MPLWPFALGGPSGTGIIRSCPEDFVVEELLGFQPSQNGEHVFLYIQKTGENTDYIARQLAKFAGVRAHDVGYAGLKDRHGITSQWFSVWLPGKAEPDWNGFTTGSIRVLRSTRHARKLKRGALAGNRFLLVVRELQANQATISEQLHLINRHGLPNYYGEQRFGHQGQNIAKALALFGGAKVRREQRSIYLSAARSYLFNQILSLRVRDNSWNQAITGDMYQLEGSKSCFKSMQPDEEIKRRLEAMDIHPCGALWGKGEPEVTAQALEIQEKVMAEHKELAAGLIASGLKLDRRTLRVTVKELAWDFSGPDRLNLSFTLPAGSYATALLREIVDYGHN